MPCLPEQIVVSVILFIGVLLHKKRTKFDFGSFFMFMKYLLKNVEKSTFSIFCDKIVGNSIVTN